MPSKRQKNSPDDEENDRSASIADISKIKTMRDERVLLRMVSKCREALLLALGKFMSITMKLPKAINFTLEDSDFISGVRALLPTRLVISILMK
jgi:hypothetical protein